MRPKQEATGRSVQVAGDQSPLSEETEFSWNEAAPAVPFICGSDYVREPPESLLKQIVGLRPCDLVTLRRRSGKASYFLCEMSVWFGVCF